MDSVSYLLSRLQHFFLPRGVVPKQKRRESGEEVDDNVKHSRCDHAGLVTGLIFSLGSYGNFLPPSFFYLFLSISLLLCRERPDLGEKNP